MGAFAKCLAFGWRCWAVAYIRALQGGARERSEKTFLLAVRLLRGGAVALKHRVGQLSAGAFNDAALAITVGDRLSAGAVIAVGAVLTVVVVDGRCAVVVGAGRIGERCNGQPTCATVCGRSGNGRLVGGVARHQHHRGRYDARRAHLERWLAHREGWIGVQAHVFRAHRNDARPDRTCGQGFDSSKERN